MLKNSVERSISQGIWSEYLVQNFGRGVTITVVQCILLLVGLLVSGNSDPVLIGIPAAIIIIFVAAYFVYYAGWPNVAVGMCQTSPLILIPPVSFLLPWVQFESLFFLPLAISTLIHVESIKWSKRLIGIHFSLLFLCQIFEFYFQEPVAATREQVLANQMIAFSVVIFIMVTIILTLFSLNSQKQKWIDKEKVLLESQALYRNLFDHSFDAIVIYNPAEGHALQVNDTFQQIFQFDAPAGPFQLHLADFVAPIQTDGQPSLEYIRACFETLAKSKTPLHFDFLHKRQDGTFFETETTLMPHPFSSELVIVMIKDVSAQKQAEKALQKSKARYKEIIASSPSGISIFDAKGDHLYVSPRSSEIFGYRGIEDSPGKSIFLYFPADEHQRMEQFISKAIEKQGVIKERFRAIHGKGHEFFIEIYTRGKRGIYDSKTEVVMIFNDITEQIKSEQAIVEREMALSKKNAELRKYISSNMELENFAYIASHDLQAPLRTISGFTQLLRRSFAGQLDQRQEEYMSFIVSSTKNMKELILALLTFSRANTTQRSLEVVDVAELLGELQTELHVVITEKNATVKSENLPPALTADRMKLKMLFQNLIVNALKFQRSDQTPVIEIKAIEKPTEWLFMVVDNGIGIESEFQDKIFLLFKRLHNQTQYEGTGIGLALCKKLVEQHGGEIGVRSEPGKGSEFYFTISKQLQPEEFAEFIHV